MTTTKDNQDDNAGEIVTPPPKSPQTPKNQKSIHRSAKSGSGRKRGTNFDEICSVAPPATLLKNRLKFIDTPKQSARTSNVGTQQDSPTPTAKKRKEVPSPGIVAKGESTPRKLTPSVILKKQKTKSLTSSNLRDAKHAGEMQASLETTGSTGTRERNRADNIRSNNNDESMTGIQENITQMESRNAMENVEEPEILVQSIRDCINATISCEEYIEQLIKLVHATEGGKSMGDLVPYLVLQFVKQFSKEEISACLRQSRILSGNDEKLLALLSIAGLWKAEPDDVALAELAKVSNS
ncbi:hypothetical protein ABW19_dt0207310 [Dactylella cylindrospora]|nr:hypothetical protein ABW19_dt0207310 [Dactylella cylindrospora]